MAHRSIRGYTLRILAVLKIHDTLERGTCGGAAIVKRAIVTGSSGLIGSEAVMFFDQLGWEVHGVDNNMRRSFFGPDGDTTWNLERFRREARHLYNLGGGRANSVLILEAIERCRDLTGKR